MGSNQSPPVGIPPDHKVHEGPFALRDLWHLPTERWAKIWSQVTGKGMRAAVLDTGIIDEHPDLPKPIETASFIRGESVTDGNGHGTHCAGTVLGRNGIGVAPECDLYVGKVLSNRGSGSSDGIAAGIRQAIDWEVDVISMSLGGGSPYQPTRDAIRIAWDKGIWVVAAAGNSGHRGNTNTVGWPAKGEECTCVGSIKEDGLASGFSSGGEQLDVCAPGSNIISAGHRGGLVSMSGTSMATPYFAGNCILIKQMMRQIGMPTLRSAQQLRDFLKINTVDKGAKGRDRIFGYGELDYLNLVERMADDDVKYL